MNKKEPENLESLQAECDKMAQCSAEQCDNMTHTCSNCLTKHDSSYTMNVAGTEWRLCHKCSAKIKKTLNIAVQKFTEKQKKKAKNRRKNKHARKSRRIQKKA